MKDVEGLAVMRAELVARGMRESDPLIQWADKRISALTRYAQARYSALRSSMEDKDEKHSV